MKNNHNKESVEPIITSLLDQDLYKITMMQIALFRFPQAIVKHEFKLRNKDVSLTPFLQEIQSQINHLEDVRFQPSELKYLRDKLSFIKPEFIPFLKMFRFDISQIKVFIENDELKITTHGPWWQTILYEIFVLSIVNEVYFKNQIKDLSDYEISNLKEEGRKRLNEKLSLIKDVDGFQFIEFGTRRRFSKSWQHEVINHALHQLPKDRLIGSSNVLLAKEFGLIPIGTMAHEYLQAFQGLGICPLVNSQETALKEWSDFYEGDLGIALTDVINMDSFLKSFNMKFSKLFDGLRHDSGDPKVWGDKAIEHYKKMKIDPMSKTLVFSDGLTFEKALDIFHYFNGRIKVSFGIGTNFTNDLGLKPLNIVMKMTECNGKPVAKISDSPGKGMCKDAEFLSYLLKVHEEKKGLFEKPDYFAHIY